jgi:hypothetical protein
LIPPAVIGNIKKIFGMDSCHTNALGLRLEAKEIQADVFASNQKKGGPRLG